MSKITAKTLETQVWSRLKEVMDPELNIDIVSLGLVYGVKVAPDEKTDKFLVWITMTLTTPGCPLAGTIQDLVREVVASLAAVSDQDNVSIELTFDPPWVVDMMSPAARAELGI